MERMVFRVYNGKVILTAKVNPKDLDKVRCVVYADDAVSSSIQVEIEIPYSVYKACPRAIFRIAGAMGATDS